MNFLSLFHILGRPDANGGCFGCGCLTGIFWILLAGILLFVVLDVMGIALCDLAYIGEFLCNLDI